MTYILDASAMIAYLRDEPGADLVDEVAHNGHHVCFAHGMNLCEVYYDYHRSGGAEAAAQAIELLRSSDIWFRSDMSEEFWIEVGVLKSETRRVSLADCCALVLTRRLNATLLTSDHHEMDSLAGDHQIQFIR